MKSKEQAVIFFRFPSRVCIAPPPSSSSHHVTRQTTHSPFLSLSRSLPSHRCDDVAAAVVWCARCTAHTAAHAAAERGGKKGVDARGARALAPSPRPRGWRAHLVCRPSPVDVNDSDDLASACTRNRLLLPPRRRHCRRAPTLENRFSARSLFSLSLFFLDSLVPSLVRCKMTAFLEL